MSWIDQRPDDAMDGAFTAVAPAPVSSVEPPAFREAMSRLGAAVHIVTTAGPGRQIGLHRDGGLFGVRSAGNAARLSQSWQLERADPDPERRVLRQHARRQRRKTRRPVCRSRRRASRRAFNAGEWMTLKTGAPVLASAVVAFDCRTIEIKAVASHNVMFGVGRSGAARAERSGARLSRAGL